MSKRSVRKYRIRELKGKRVHCGMWTQAIELRVTVCGRDDEQCLNSEIAMWATAEDVLINVCISSDPLRSRCSQGQICKKCVRLNAFERKWSELEETGRVIRPCAGLIQGDLGNAGILDGGILDCSVGQRKFGKVFAESQSQSHLSKICLSQERV